MYRIALCLAGALVSTAAGAAVGTIIKPPPMRADSMVIPAIQRAVYVAPLPRLEARAEPSRVVEVLDVCDYDDGGPCWCWGFYNMRSMRSFYGNQHFCESATEYLLSVSEYGKPRGGVFVSFMN